MQLPDRPASLADSPVAAWSERVVIPTYPTQPPDRNPMFLEQRVYQGSSGRVYPNPFTDRLSDERVDVAWEGVHLENAFVRLMVLPEIGGRIHVGRDLTNGYDFFYLQPVIKPALVGLLGPWISGGVEFNWPQHHRPSTFMPTDWAVEELPDGGRTIWLSEHEPMNRMKGMHGVTLRPGSSVVEVRVRIFNRTPLRQTFLWWANVAARVHDEYQSFFPPDVTYVADHAKRAMTTFPVARGRYYGVDYGTRDPQDADLRWYRNIPVPMSYMAMGTSDDFFGGYDHAAQAGFVHWADHRIAPGKKQWTWGDDDFGHAWDRELTDGGGPYVELMAGVFTDNQPDFSFLAPYETREFRQFWFPIRAIGPAHAATLNAAASLVIDAGRARVGVSATRVLPGARIRIAAAGRTVFERTADLGPDAPVLETLPLSRGARAHELDLSVKDAQGRELLRYRATPAGSTPPPPTATEPPLPEDVATNEELYLTGLHLEQYRHATRRPEAYWREAIRRDPGDARSNTAMGAWRLRRGELDEAERHLRTAIARQTARNPNPSDGESHYLLGLVLRALDRYGEANEVFAKAGWNAAWQAPAGYARAQLASLQGDHALARILLDRVLAADTRQSAARVLRAALARRDGDLPSAVRDLSDVLAADPLDAWALHERRLLASAGATLEPGLDARLASTDASLPGGYQTALDVAHDEAAAGLLDEAIELLRREAPSDYGGVFVSPLTRYALAWLLERRAAAGDSEAAAAEWQLAAAADPSWCFPARLEEIRVLEAAQQANPVDARAPYYLGNLLYDRRRYEAAIAQWERAARLDPAFPTTWRNLGIAEYNVRHRPARALAAYRRAFRADPTDARVLYELDQLRKRLNHPPADRLRLLERNRALVDRRDDLSVERVTLLNLLRRHADARDALAARRFHPWEGGEGLMSGQWVAANRALAFAELAAGRADQALKLAVAAIGYPENLGEGRHPLTPLNDLQLLRGLALRALGSPEAERWLAAASEPQGDPAIAAGEAVAWQAEALLARGRQAEARARLQMFLLAVRRRAREGVRIDYFATSLPSLLLFDDDLRHRNAIECRYLEGLALGGLGRVADAKRRLKDVLDEDVAHVGATEALARLAAPGWREP
jgi:tetratricopeptide (TPR) repeat protein